MSVTLRLFTVIAGVWLMFAPAVLGYGDPAAANDRLTGPAVAGSAFVAMWPVLRPVRWMAVPFGLWLLIVPFVLGYGTVSTVVSSVVTGLVVLITSPPGAADPDRFGGGWRTLWISRPTAQGQP